MGPKTRENLAELAVQVKAEKQALTDERKMAIREKITAPGGLVVVSQVKSEDTFRAKEDYAAVSCAIQNIQLAAHAESLGAKWSTGAITRDARTYEIIGIDVELEDIVGFVWIGIPRVVPAIKRPEFETVVRRLK